eukprot:963395-Prymnesium_polylepis.1
MLIRVWTHRHKLSLSLSSNSTGAILLSFFFLLFLPPALAIPAVGSAGASIAIPAVGSAGASIVGRRAAVAF